MPDARVRAAESLNDTFRFTAKINKAINSAGKECSEHTNPSTSFGDIIAFHVHPVYDEIRGWHDTHMDHAKVLEGFLTGAEEDVSALEAMLDKAFGANDGFKDTIVCVECGRDGRPGIPDDEIVVWCRNDDCPRGQWRTRQHARKLEGKNK